MAQQQPRIAGGLLQVVGQCDTQEEAGSGGRRGIHGAGYEGGVDMQRKGGLLEGKACIEGLLDDGVAGGDGWGVGGCVGEAIVCNYGQHLYGIVWGGVAGCVWGGWVRGGYGLGMG